MQGLHLICVRELLLLTLRLRLRLCRISVWIFFWRMRDLRSRKRELVYWNFKANT